VATVLHLIASPRGDQSYSRRTAEAFLKSYEDTHPDDRVETLDLYDGTIPAFGTLCATGKYKIMTGKEQTEEEREAWKDVERTIEQFKAADKLVISSPMWNFGIPYVLKQYFDIVVQPHYTFEVTSEGYKGLVTGKPALLFLARGGEYLPGTPGEGLDYQKPYLEFILGFMGFKKISSIVVEPTLQGGADTAEAKLLAAIEEAQSQADKF